MKFVIVTILALSCLVSARAQQHIIAFATLKTETEAVSTPKSYLSGGVEAIRRASFKSNNIKYTFALKSSAFKKNDKFHYAVALSLSDTKKDDFIVSDEGVTDTLSPINFSFEKDGVHYTATVNLVSE